MMMFGGGSAASTPAGAMPQTGQLGSGISNSIKSATDTMVAQKTIDKLTEEIANTKADTQKVIGDTMAPDTKTQSVTAGTWNTIADTYLKRGQFNRADLDSLLGRYGKEFFDTPAGKLLWQAGTAGEGVSKVIKPVTDFMGVGKSALDMYWKGKTASDKYRFGDW